MTWIQVRLRVIVARVALEYCPRQNDTKAESGLCIAIQGRVKKDKPNSEYVRVLHSYDMKRSQINEINNGETVNMRSINAILDQNTVFTF